VTAVGQFIELWRGVKISMLNFNFGLGNEHASHIDRWIVIAIIMAVEEAHLDFIDTDSSRENYHFPSHLMDFENSSLKFLCPNKCKLHFSHGYKSCVSHLTILDLNYVPLHQSGVRCILSGALNLTSLTLSHCY
jgi:hypothetical protein